MHLRYNFSTSQVSVAEGRDFRFCYCPFCRRRRELVNCDNTTAFVLLLNQPPPPVCWSVRLPPPRIYPRLAASPLLLYEGAPNVSALDYWGAAISCHRECECA